MRMEFFSHSVPGAWWRRNRSMVIRSRVRRWLKKSAAPIGNWCAPKPRNLGGTGGHAERRRLKWSTIRRRHQMQTHSNSPLMVAKLQSYGSIGGAGLWPVLYEASHAKNFRAFVLN